MTVLTTYLPANAVPLMNGDSDIKCDMRQISCVSVSSASTLCSCHVLEFHLQISPVSNCGMKLKIVIYFWCMETEEIRLRESFKWHCMLFSFSVHGFLQTQFFLHCFSLNVFSLQQTTVKGKRNKLVTDKLLSEWVSP